MQIYFTCNVTKPFFPIYEICVLNAFVQFYLKLVTIYLLNNFRPQTESIYAEEIPCKIKADSKYEIYRIARKS